MKATFISREINTVSMTMEITAEEFENAINKAYKAKRNLFTVDGFRKGKAPRKLIESKYGKGVFYEDALSEAFNDNYATALEEIGYEPVDHPDIDLGDQQVESGKGIVFNIKFVTEPEVDVKNYKGIHVEVPAAVVTEDDIDTQLRSYAQRNARLVTVDRAAGMGDTVVLDYAGFTQDGEQFDGGTAEGHRLKLGSHEFIPGFEEQLVGVKAGDERDVDCTFPIDYPGDRLAGQVVTFKCKIHEVKEEELPPIDDDLAKECSEFDTLDEWKKEIEEKVLANKKQQNENRAQNEILNHLYEETIIDIPEVMIEHQIDDLLRNFDQQLSYSGMGLNEYLEATHTDMDEFREQVRNEAEKKVKTRLIVEAIAEKEGLTAEEDEIQEELKKMSVQYGVTPEKMAEIIGDDIKYLKKEISGKKAIQLLTENAVIEEVEENSGSDETPEAAAEEAEKTAETADEASAEEEKTAE